MFIHEKNRVGTLYFEFQFCKIKNPVRFNKVKSSKVEHWKKDSLLLHLDNAERFFELYLTVFNCALHPNGTSGYDGFGINYYDVETTKKILFELKNIIKEEYKDLMIWLEDAMTKYNGFYILGI